jgi:hypothetical protein
MKQFFSLLFLFVFVSGLSFAQNAFDKAGKQTTPVVPIILGEPQYEAPAVVLYDNGPLVNAPGGGFGGADASVLQSAITLTIYGFGHQVLNNNSMADDFTVTGSGWIVDQMQFFAYQTGSTTTSTMNDIRVQIWDGDPTAGGVVIWGDMTTNRLASSTFTNIYRSIDTAPLASNRPIMVSTATIGTTLAPGTYWVQWMTGGTLASGPWAPPITINGVTATGNGKQNLAGVWGNAMDLTFQQGLPFIVLGTAVSSGNTFFDDFEAYVAGQQLACQNPVDWTTWSIAPCGSEDAFISSNYAYSGTNSTVVVTNNDLVKPLGSKTTGIWYISFYVYIPSGKSGYFNTLNGFTPNPFQWGMECYFDLGGAGRLVELATTNFSWTPDTWQFVQVVVDLDLDQAQFWFNGSMVNSWQWTRGNPGSYALRLDANDFFGATANDEMYFDDYRFADTPVPVELTSFTAIDNNGAVELNWTTATETNNQMFEIQRQSSGSEFTTVGFVSGHGTTTETQQYNYVDRTVSTGTYSYRLKQVDFDGSYEYSDVVEVDVQAPIEFALDQNYPNPFNPSTSIKYSVPETGNVRLAVFNLIGEEVAVLVNGSVQAGQYEVSFNASSLPSGVYLYKLQSANSVEVKKMMLLK